MKVAAILGERQAELAEVPDPTLKQAFETSASHESSKIILKPWE